MTKASCIFYKNGVFCVNSKMERIVVLYVHHRKYIPENEFILRMMEQNVERVRGVGYNEKRKKL